MGPYGWPVGPLLPSFPCWIATPLVIPQQMLVFKISADNVEPGLALKFHGMSAKPGLKHMQCGVGRKTVGTSARMVSH